MTALALLVLNLRSTSIGVHRINLVIFSMYRWAGRVALVTGASRGIGAAICRELVKEGMTVIGCARNEGKIEELANLDFMKEYKGKLHAMKCDMSQESEILAMHEVIRSKFGRIDVCINNAVSSVVGILGVCINTREAVKLMREKNIDDGHIIHMGSIVGHKILSFQKPPENVPILWFHFYSGMKHMIRALSEGLRQELSAAQSKIRVSTISPGSVETELLARSSGIPELAEQFFSAYKCLQPEDVAEAVTNILKSAPRVNVHDIILEPVEFQI